MYNGLVLLMGILVVDAATHMNASTESCSSPFVSVGGHCLHFDFSFQGTWHETRQFCLAMGADLVILSDPQLYADVLQHIDTLDVTDIHFWIGATDEANEGHWMWIDGTPVRMGPPFWLTYGCDDTHKIMPTGGTAQNCIILDGNWWYYFNDLQCDLPRNAICDNKHF